MYGDNFHSMFCAAAKNFHFTRRCDELYKLLTADVSYFGTYSTKNHTEDTFISFELTFRSIKNEDKKKLRNIVAAIHLFFL